MSLLSRLFGGAGADFAEMISNGAKVIDVRTPGEFKSGNFKGSINIPLDTIQKNVTKIKGYNTAIILVCRSGGRASSAEGVLSKAGIECHNAGAWQNLN